MKREIKFRGKRTDNGAWVYGGLHLHQEVKLCVATAKEVEENEKAMILVDGMADWNLPVPIHSIEVDGETVGQFTGLKDKNGKEVYEGDVLRIEYFKIAVGENLGVYETEAELTGVMGFDGLSLILQNIVGEKWQEYTGYDAGEGNCKFMYLGDVYEGSLDASYQIEVIGNIYENPELLKA